jgi:hypothetical protein
MLNVSHVAFEICDVGGDLWLEKSRVRIQQAPIFR